MEMQREGGNSDGCCRCSEEQPRVPPTEVPTPLWVTAALHASGHLPPSDTVVSVTPAELTGGLAGDVPNGGGMSGARLLKLRFEHQDAPVSSPAPNYGGRHRTTPTTAIHKFASYEEQVPRNICSDGGCMTRYFQWASGLRSDTALAQEAVFFQQVAPVLGDGVSIPKIYHVGLEGSFSHNGCFFICCFDCCFCIGCRAGNVNVRSSIVQEDLAARGLISTHLMSRDSPPLSVTRTAIRQIARLHRWGWDPADASGHGADHALLLKTRADAPESGVCAQKTGQHWWVRNTVEAYGGSPALETFIDVWSSELQNSCQLFFYRTFFWKCRDKGELPLNNDFVLNDGRFFCKFEASAIGPSLIAPLG